MNESKELIALSQPLNPLVVFGEGGVDSILEQITVEVRAIDTDISTAMGRTALASLAYKIARSKTALDDMGKNLAAEWKQKSAKVDTERRRIREALDALKDEIRKPLTDWEQAEVNRVKGHETALAEIVALSTFDAPPASETIKARLDPLLAGPATEWREWEEFTKRATEARATVIIDLQTLLAATEKWEAEQAELVRLRAEKAEREQRERDDRLRAEAAETARLEAERKAREDARRAAEKVENQRRESEERFNRETARRVKVEREKVEAESRAKEAMRLAAEKAERDKLAAEKKAKADAQVAVETERRRVKELAEKEAAETAKREADRKHKAKINNEVLNVLISIGLTSSAGKAVIGAIATGNVPHVKITY